MVLPYGHLALNKMIAGEPRQSVTLGPGCETAWLLTDRTIEVGYTIQGAVIPGRILSRSALVRLASTLLAISENTFLYLKTGKGARTLGKSVDHAGHNGSDVTGQ